MSHNPAVNRFTTEPIICAVMGLGYVGLPLCVTIAEAGLDVIGFDIDETVIRSLRSGRSNTVDITDARLTSALESRLTVSSNGDDLSRADAVFICVPSPLGSHREPDLSFIRSAAQILTSVAKPGLLVSLESTTYPGTTSDVLVPVLTSDGLTLDTDLFVAFSPERVSPASEVQLKEIPKVVGGVTETSSIVAAAVYRRFIDSVHVVSSAENAEFTKLLENTFRAVNIALMNELAQFADRIGVDVWEAIDAAATKPFGFTAFYPGPGVGGHCIPLDPQYLAWRAREVGSSLTFIDAAERVNGSMPEYVARRAVDILNEQSKSVRGAKILAVGIAYKPDVADDRESASIEVLRILHRGGAEVHVVDPHISDERIRMHGFTPAGEHTDGYDLAIILTDHSGIEYGKLANSAKAVFDTRNVYGRLGLDVSGINVL
jgi:UDP-N-acetyl-D-glucosamine dehydrogenase